MRGRGVPPRSRGGRSRGSSTRQSTLYTYMSEDQEEQREDDPAVMDDPGQCDDDWEDVPRKTPRLIYEYFTAGLDTEGKATGKAKCNSCGQELAVPDSTTATLIRHLKSKHSTSYVEYEKKARDRTDKKAKKRKLDTRQPTVKESIEVLNPLPNDSARAKAIKKVILEMIIMDYQPLSIVEDIGFSRLIRFFEKRFVMPSRSQFTRRLLPTTYKMFKKRLQKILDKELPSVKSITFTTDGWTSKGGTCYFSMTLNYMNGKGVNRSWDLGAFNFPESHTAHNIYDKFKGEMLTKWNIDIEDESRKSYIVTDNAPNMRAAFSNKIIQNLSCTIHTLQLAIDDSLKTVNMEPVFKKVRAGVGHYKHSHLSSERLRAIQKSLDLPELALVQMVDPRWNSIYLMLSRYVTLEKALRVDLPETGNADALLSESDWAMVKGITKVLEPIYEATLQLGKRDCPTFSMVFPIIVTILEKLQAFINNSSNRGSGLIYARALHKAVKSRFAFLISHGPQSNEYLLATLIDPRFKGVMFDHGTVSRGKTLLMQEANFYHAEVGDNDINPGPPSPPRESGISLWSVLETRSKQAREEQETESPFLSAIETINKEIDDYLRTGIIGPTEDPWAWWRANAHKFKLLAPIALKFLSIPASSIDSERLFSKMGQILTARRARLSASLVEMIIFLHCNYLILERDEFSWTHTENVEDSDN